MPDVPRRPDLFELWGFTQEAINDPAIRSQPGGIARYIWESYKQTVVAATEQPTPLTIFDVNRLVSAASSLRQGRLELAGALQTHAATGFDQAITGRMQAPDLDLGAGAGSARPYQYRIRFGATLSVGGVPQGRWLTYETGVNGPASTRELQVMAEDAARTYAERYGMEFEGLTGGFELAYF